MTKKQRKSPPQEAEPVFGNLFADLKIDFPAGSEPKKSPAEKAVSSQNAQKKEAEQNHLLSKEDQELLKAFGESVSLPTLENGNGAKENSGRKGAKLTLTRERKGHGGKTVTLVHGLKEETLDVQMTLCSQLKSALGIGARFVDGVLELQGDQRSRAAEQLEKAGYICRIV